MGMPVVRVVDDNNLPTSVRAGSRECETEREVVRLATGVGELHGDKRWEERQLEGG